MVLCLKHEVNVWLGKWPLHRNPHAGPSDEWPSQGEARLKSIPCIAHKASPEWDAVEELCFPNISQPLHSSSKDFGYSKDTFLIGAWCSQRTVFMATIALCGGKTWLWLYSLEIVTSCPEPVSHPPPQCSSDVDDSWHLYKSAPQNRSRLP